MGKNKKNNQVVSKPLTADALEENSAIVQTDNNSKTNANLPAKTDKKKKNDKNKSKESGFVRFFKKIGRAFKGMVEELKKVTWPTFTSSLKSTGVVLVFVVVFLVILMAIDALFGLGFNSLIRIPG